MMSQQTLDHDEILHARQVHLVLNTAFYPLCQREQLTIPMSVLGCREFIAEALARISAAHHNSTEAKKAFDGFVKALWRSVQRNVTLLQSGKDGEALSWCPEADTILKDYDHFLSRKEHPRDKNGLRL